MTMATPEHRRDVPADIALVCSLPLALYATWLTLLATPTAPYGLGPWILLAVAVPGLLKMAADTGRITRRAWSFGCFASTLLSVVVLIALRAG